MKFNHLVAALALFAGMLGAAPAQAQGCGPSNPNCIVTTMPPGDASNRAASDAFVAQAISPFSPPGGSNGQIQYNNNGVLGGFTASGDVAINTATGAATIQPNAVTSGKIADSNVTNTKLAPGAANTFKGSLNGTATSDISLTACSLSYQVTKWVTGTGWQCGINPVLPSRATAATLDLSAYTTVTTQAYAAAGDGGGATFKNVGAAPFKDSYVTAGTISAAGTGYTNGTYYSVFFVGGTGNNFIANVTVAGGVVTTVTIINAGGFAYTAGDVITPSAGNAQIGGTGSGFTWTVSTVSAPRASFTDSAGNHWQYVQGDVIYAKQFGAKFDWYRPTGDAGATNDQASIQAALNYASYVNEFAVNFVTNSLAGTAVVWPSGTALVCGAPLRQFSSTWARGQGPQNSMLKMCDTGIGAAENFYTVCDERARLACFGGQISDFGLVALIAAPGNSGTYMLYSNAAQQQRFISNVSIYSGTRGCFRYDIGYGGAAIVGIYDYFCTVATGNTQTAANVVNATSTMFSFHNGVIEGSAYTGFGIAFFAGLSKFESFHFEGITTPILVDMPVATDKLLVDNITGGSNCLEMVRLQGTNTLNNFSITQTHKQGVCINLVLDGQPAGVSRAADVPPGVFVNFNP